MSKEAISLYYREGTSDKVYQASIEPSGSGWVVNFAYGRRGATLKPGSKTSSPVAYDAAKKIYDGLISEKTAKGYTPGEDGTPYVQASGEKLDTGLHCQLLNPIEESELSKYLNDDDYFMQQKYDGKRMILSYADGVLKAINRKGLECGCPEVFLKECKKIARTCGVAYSRLTWERTATSSKNEFILDGEAVGEKFYVFDILSYNNEDTRSWEYSDRYSLVNRTIPLVPDAIFFSVINASDEHSKRDLFYRLTDKNAEGVVFKKRTAPYKAGRPPHGGSQVKFKFWASASCVVKGVNTKRSVSLLIAGIDVGNVTIPPNRPLPTAGDVVEVKYLYSYKDGSLYQPIYLGVRDDIHASECLVSQLKYKAEDSDDE